MLDLRRYKLVPGGRDAFDRIFREGALPMLHRPRHPGAVMDVIET